jgi:hypothetical protein
MGEEGDRDRHGHRRASKCAQRASGARCSDHPGRCDHRPSRNVSGSALANPDPPQCDYFQKAGGFKLGSLVAQRLTARAADLAGAPVELRCSAGEQTGPPGHRDGAGGASGTRCPDQPDPPDRSTLPSLWHPGDTFAESAPLVVLHSDFDGLNPVLAAKLSHFASGNHGRRGCAPEGGHNDQISRANAYGRADGERRGGRNS